MPHEFPICESLQRQMGFAGIASDDIPKVLAAYKGLLMEAIERSDGENAWPDVVQNLTDGFWQLWITPDSAAVTCIREQGQFNVCVVIYAGGVLKDAITCMPGMMEWARAMGCKKIHIEGRKGWGPALERFGAKLKYHVYSIDLES